VIPAVLVSLLTPVWAVAVTAGGPGPIARAIAAATPGDTVVVAAGVHREPTIVVDRSITLRGEPGAILDGEGVRGLIEVRAPDVTITGLTFRNTGHSYIEDRAALLIDGARDCVVADNRFEATFFAIYLARTRGCVVRGNVVRGVPTSEASTGNAVHSWGSHDLVVDDNTLSGHRDGLYFEFTSHATVTRNLSTGNLRYGLHFMYADSSAYTGNQFVANGSGVAVMYSHQVAMIDNRFGANRGPASYGLLLKEINDVRLQRNRFDHNSTGLLADGANRVEAIGNEFTSNGWAIRLLASTAGGHFEANAFRGNSFDVVVNSKGTTAEFTGNWWDAYRGWDLDRDGVGDVPHHPIRLFALLVERAPAAMLLQRSLFVRVIDAAERTVPVLTPTNVVDRQPAMTAPRALAP